MIAVEEVDLSGLHINQTGLFLSAAERGIVTPKEILRMIPQKTRESDEELRTLVHSLYGALRMFGVTVVPSVSAAACSADAIAISFSWGTSVSRRCMLPGSLVSPSMLSSSAVDTKVRAINAS